MALLLNLDWIRNIRTVGATGTLGPYTSHMMAGKLLSSLDESVRDQDRITLVEFGAGPGNISKEILSHEKISGFSGSIDCFLYETLDSNILALHTLFSDEKRQELNRGRTHPITIHIRGSAETVGDDCKDQSVDGIVSTIPVTLLPAELLHTIFTRAHSVLKNRGVFVSGQYRQNTLYPTYFGEPEYNQRPIFNENVFDLISSTIENITDYFPPLLVTIFRK